MNVSLRSGSLEPLEDRVAPAGIVTVVENAPGDFTLTGDVLDNHIAIFQTTPGAFRFEGRDGTVFNPGGVPSMEITKLTKLSVLGGDGSDSLRLSHVSTLTSLSVDGGPGADNFVGTDVAIKKNVDFSGGAGLDFFTFEGLTTKIGGNVLVSDSTEGIQCILQAQKMVIGGTVTVQGGTDSEVLTAAGTGTLSIAKGIQFDSGSAGIGAISSGLQTSLTIGKLPTGESINYLGNADGSSIFIGTGDVILAGGVRVVGGAAGDGLFLGDPNRTLKIGKLSSGHSIDFDGGLGPDTVGLLGVKVLVAGGIEFDGGDGANTLTLGNFGGKLTVRKLSTGQSLLVTGGGDFDFVAINASVVKFAGGVEWSPGNGPNSFTLNSSSGTATFGKLPTGASLKILGGTSNDTVTLNSGALVLAGGIDFAADSGTNSMSFADPNGRVLVGKFATGQSLIFGGGNGDDSFTASSATTNFAGGIEFFPGAGVNSLEFAGRTSMNIGKFGTGRSIHYFGGAGEDAIDLDPANIILAGGIHFEGFDGDNTVNLDANSVSRLGSLSTGQSILYTGGAAGDSVFVGGPRVEFKGSIEMTAGDGTSFLDVDGLAKIGQSAAGVSIQLIGGTGADEVDLKGNITLAGSLSFEGGAGNDFMELISLDALRVGGPVVFDAGAGLDTFNLNANSLALAKGIDFAGGVEADTFALVADGTIRGDVFGDLGAAIAGTQNFILTSKSPGLPRLFLKGALNVASTGTVLSADNLTLTSLSVTRDISLVLGSGISTTAIDNLLAAGTLLIDTGLGNDVVLIERQNFVGNSVIAKLATILTGAGNDTVSIGAPTPLPNTGLADSTRVRFLAGLTLDGGADNDTRNNIDTENDFPGGPPTGLGTFETIVP